MPSSLLHLLRAGGKQSWQQELAELATHFPATEIAKGQ
jgi:hypothetical protein